MMKGFPEEVTALVGESPRILDSSADAVLLFGNDLVAKLAPPEMVERETFVISGQAGALPLNTPTLVDWGVNWLVMKEIEYSRNEWTDDELQQALRELAALHDRFEGSAVLDSPILLRPFGHGIRKLFEQTAEHTSYLSPTLLAVLGDPSPLIDVLSALPLTMTHGDPWPHNLLRSNDKLIWLDWSHASVAPAVADVASWLDQTPFAIGRTVDRRSQIDAYLSARTTRVEPESFSRGLDAARVAWFLAYDAPKLSGLEEESPELAGKMIEEAERALSAVTG